MARPKPWLKMWVEWIDDPKMLSLTLAEQGAWWRLLTLAQKCMADGALVKGNDSPLSLDEIATTLRITAKADRKVFDSMVQKMSSQGSLHWNDSVLVVTHFAERQAKITSDTPEAIRDRVRRHRENLEKLKEEAEFRAVTENPLQKERERSKEKETPPLPPEEEGEGEAEVTSLQDRYTPLHVTENPLQPSLALAKISELHENLFGIITPVLSEKFKNFVENYRGPVEWIEEAFAEAVAYKNRRWAYVEAILHSWQEKGGPHADRRPEQTGRRAGAPREYTKEDAERDGWSVTLGDEPESGDED